MNTLNFLCNRAPSLSSLRSLRHSLRPSRLLPNLRPSIPSFLRRHVKPTCRIFRVKPLRTISDDLIDPRLLSPDCPIDPILLGVKKPKKTVTFDKFDDVCEVPKWIPRIWGSCVDETVYKDWEYLDIDEEAMDLEDLEEAMKEMQEAMGRSSLEDDLVGMMEGLGI